MATTILRMRVTLQRTGESRSGHYKNIQDGLFTRPVKIGTRASGHPEHEVEAIIAARIAGMSDDEIRELVKKLEANRKSAL